MCSDRDKDIETTYIMNKSTQDKIREEYAPLVKTFVENVINSKLNTEGVPALNLPKAGDYYDECTHKIAFIGMETKGWGKMSEFIKLGSKLPEEAINYKDLWFKEGKRYKHLKPATFWGFIVTFLEKFYGCTKRRLIRKDGTYHEILSSFVWGNCNSLERYCVTAKKNNADKSHWEKIKEFSFPFDDIEHIIKATKPQLIFITYTKVDKDRYLKSVGCEKIISNKNLHLHHYSIEVGEQKTHVFIIPHPTWIVRSKCYGGYKKYIKELINYIKECSIWSDLPVDK